MMELNDGSPFDSSPHTQKKTFQSAEEPSEQNDSQMITSICLMLLRLIQFQRNILISHQQKDMKTKEDCADSLCSRQLDSE